MSASNYFKKREEAFELRTKDVTAAYTVRVGGSTDNHIADRVITITNPTANFNINVPDGSYEGQELLISLLSNDSAVTVGVVKTTPAGTTGLTDVGDYLSLEWANSEAGWAALAGETD